MPLKPSWRQHSIINQRRLPHEFNRDRDIAVNHADDGDRLIQEVLTELGWDAEARKIAENVRRLDLGLPSKDQFIAICSWLGKALLVHKLDQQQAPLKSREAYQVADLLAQFDTPVHYLLRSSLSRSKPCHSRRITSNGSTRTPNSSACHYLSHGNTMASGYCSRLGTSPRRARTSTSELEGESRRDRSGSREGLPVRRSVGFLGRIHRPADAVSHPRGQRLNGVAPVSKLRHKRASREGN